MQFALVLNNYRRPGNEGREYNAAYDSEAVCVCVMIMSPVLSASLTPSLSLLLPSSWEQYRHCPSNSCFSLPNINRRD